MPKSKCCGAKIVMSFVGWKCAKCENWTKQKSEIANLDDSTPQSPENGEVKHQVPSDGETTPPTSTDVEEVMLLLWNNGWANGNGDDYDADAINKARKAVTRLIQQAELRGNTNALKAAKTTLTNHSYEKTMKFLDERISQQEVLLTAIKESDAR